MVILFWISLFLLSFPYIQYPLLLCIISLFVRRRFVPGDIKPTVSIIIAAHNEEKHVEHKIRDVLGLDYPRERMEVLIGSDGSTDRTVEIALRFESKRVRILAFPEQRGKTAVQNDCVVCSSGEILIFMDAASMCNKEAVRRLVRHFADERVGCVAGSFRFVYRNQMVITESQSIYWRCEQVIKRLEGRLGSMVGMDGPLYGIRRQAYSHLPHDIMSDFASPLVAVQHGYVTVFEPGAIALEEASSSIADEFRTRRRIALRGFVVLSRFPDLLNPFKSGFLTFQIISHKIMRWAGGFFCMGLLGSTSLLMHRPFYLGVALVMALFCCTAVVGLVLQAKGRRAGLFSIPCYFVLVTLSGLLGFADFLAKKRAVSWSPVREGKRQ